MCGGGSVFFVQVYQFASSPKQKDVSEIVASDHTALAGELAAAL